ncbi:MAG: hypothetical protein IAE65_06970 [Ignavibacteria bacterium]|nr:hypothetical protein [Ignavibacteria bacterium]
MRKFLFCFSLFNLFFISLNSYSQIKIFERNTTDTSKNKNLYNETITRKILPLNGTWQLSFNEGVSFSDFVVPCAYDFEGKVIFKRKFIIPDSLTENYSFILAAEGINYESEIKINNVFITKHTGGYSSVVNLIDENILTNDNNIEIIVDNELNYTGTFPLKGRIDYPKNYGGIYRDIYLVAVPKIYIQSVDLNISGATNNPVIKSNLTVKTTELNKIYQSKEFSLNIEIRDRFTGNIIQKSNDVKFETDNFNSKNIEVTINPGNLNLWSPENPYLYDIICYIKDSANNIADEFIFEYGFREINTNKNSIILNGNNYILKGINYYEYTENFASAIDYSQLRKDIENIKSLGVNCIRLPGASASPYLINLANEYGIFIIEEIPANEVPFSILSDESYIESAKKYLSEIILRDKNDPSVLFWGIGNDFDVTNPLSNNYVEQLKTLANEHDKRKIFYSSRNFYENKINSADVTGLNLTDVSFEEYNKFLEYGNNNPAIKKFFESPVLISSYGIRIDNNNRNGYSDKYSVEAQTKYLIEFYNVIKNKFQGSFISSYADRISDRPLNFPLDINKYLWTDGIYTIDRNPKQSVQFVERMFKNQESPKILEGENKNEISNLFIIIGVIFNIIFIFLVTQVKKFRQSFLKCLYAPKNFFLFASEQLIIPNLLNFTVCILISAGIGLFWSSVIYYYKELELFDLFLSNIFAGDNTKIFFSFLSSNPQYSIPLITLLNIILTLLTSAILYVISLFSRNYVNYKNIFTISVWSSLPFIIFLPIGTIILKLGYLNTDYIYFSILLFFGIHIIYLYRLITGGRILLQFSFTKALIYAFSIIILIYGSIFSYYYISRDTFSLIGLILSYN